MGRLYLASSRAKAWRSSVSAFQTPVFRPALPMAEALLPYLRTIDENRWYTNHGPLLQRFERRLEQIFGTHVVTSANGTLALMQVLSHFEIPVGKACLVPSWTFVASAAAIRAVGLEPRFVDVSEETWSLPVNELRARLPLRDVGAIMVISPFGAPIDLEGWSDFMRETGIPVVIDAAASFDAMSKCGPLDRVACPIMVSLHATKTFGIGEGAVVLTSRESDAASVRQRGNFGFVKAREAEVNGINAKLSEYSAAVGLASLDEWPARREQWAALTADFAARAIAVEGLSLMPGFGDGWVSSYGNVLLPASSSIEAVSECLAQAGTETRRWWGTGCHTQAAYAACVHDPLPHTEALAARVLGLPFWLGLTPAQLDAVFAVLRDALAVGSR